MSKTAEKKTPQQRGRASKNKGKVGERELANILKEHGFNARRNQQYNGAVGDADVVGVPNIHIECKRVESLNLSKAMEQSKRDARDGEAPMVFHRKNREPWYVTMTLEDWAVREKCYQKENEKCTDT